MEAVEIGGAQSSGSNIARTLSTVSAGNSAENVNSQLNQMDALNLLNSSQQIPLLRCNDTNLVPQLTPPEPAVANILSFYPNMITTPMSKGISNGLLHIYKETIVNRLPVTKEMVDSLENSDIIRLFHKLNDESIQDALTMGFSLKQIATIPSDQLSDYKARFNAYVIPVDIQNQIANLSETNGQLKLYYKELTTGQLCKILNALTNDQRNALRVLNLNSNQLTSLPESFGNLSALTELYLYNNQLISLPDSFVNLIALTELYLNNNQLTSLPDSFENLSALAVLYLRYNQLNTLPDSFGRLTSLTNLGLGENQLISLPDSFGNLTALKQLYLGENQLTSLPDSFGNLSALRVLYLKNNQLIALPNLFGRLTTLTNLYLYNNQLTSLPDSFGNLSVLTKLNLKNNKFNKDLKHAIQQRFNFATL